MTFIQRIGGELIDLDAIGIRTKDFIVSSPKYNHHTESVEGGMGLIDYGSDIVEREISVAFRMTANSFDGVPMKRDEVFELFQSQEAFYLIDRRIKGKRWLVKEAGSFSVEQRGTYGDFEVNYIGLQGIAESRGTTINLHNSGVSAEDDLWGFYSGLIPDEASLNYKFNAVVAQTFRVYNAGNLTVHPFFHDFKLSIKNVTGSAQRFRLINLTNMSRASIEIPVSPSDVIVYDGANITKNGLTVFGDTDHQYIELSPGWNNFQIYFCDSAVLEFDFRYYYK